jgi:hypothetical protein
MALDITYARSASHDRAYFNEPLKMLEGLVEPPSFNLRNPVMVGKHVHATVLTALFKLLRSAALPEAELNALQSAMKNCLPLQIKTYLFTAEGLVRSTPMQVDELKVVIQKHRLALKASVMAAFQQGWPVADADVVSAAQIESIIDGLPTELQNVIGRLFQRLQWALGQLERLRKVAEAKGSMDPDEEALRSRCERLVKKLKGEAKRRANQAEGVDDTNTYGVLAAEGFLPGYGLGHRRGEHHPCGPSLWLGHCGLGTAPGQCFGCTRIRARQSDLCQRPQVCAAYVSLDTGGAAGVLGGSGK